MFKGSTTLRVNEATLIEAVQEWLSKRCVEGYVPTVKGVRIVASPGYSAASEFEVEVRESQAPAQIAAVA